MSDTPTFIKGIGPPLEQVRADYEAMPPTGPVEDVLTLIDAVLELGAQHVIDQKHLARIVAERAALEAERDEAIRECDLQEAEAQHHYEVRRAAEERARQLVEALSVYAADDNWTFEAGEYGDVWLYVGPGDLPSDVACAALASPSRDSAEREVIGSLDWVERVFEHAPADFPERLAANFNALLTDETNAVGRLLDWVGVAAMTPLRERVLILCVEYLSRTSQMDAETALSYGQAIASPDHAVTTDSDDERLLVAASPATDDGDHLPSLVDAETDADAREGLSPTSRTRGTAQGLHDDEYQRVTVAARPPDSFWREVPCGHPQDPVAWLAPDGHFVCHCGWILDPTDALSDGTGEGAPGPLVPCGKCGCYVACPPAVTTDEETT